MSRLPVIMDDEGPFWQPYPRAGGRMEWTCPCGVGHGNHIHGCCGESCCSRPDFPGLKEIEKAELKGQDDTTHPGGGGEF